MIDSRAGLVAVAAVVCVSALIAGCAPLPTRSLSFSREDALADARRDVAPPSPTSFDAANATAAQRSDTLDRIWHAIEDYYYDGTFAGVDLPALERLSRTELNAVRSDADFYRVLQDRVGAMPDSHTNVLTPRQAQESHTQRAARIGIAYRAIDGRIVVMDVVAGFPAAELGIERGMIIEAVDGRAVDGLVEVRSADSAEARRVRDAALLKAVSAMLQSDPSRSNRLTLRRADDTLWEVDVAARVGDMPTVEALTVLPSGIGVLRLSRFDPSVIADLERDIARARLSTRGLILDLRDNPGGDTDVVDDLVEQFLSQRVVIGTVALRIWRIPVSFTIRDGPARHPYVAPLAVLIDGATGSAAEITAHVLTEVRDALPVGEPTCGCVVGLAREFELPDGGALFVAEVGFRSPGGRRMEQDPLVPVVPVAPTLAEARAGEDVFVREAERALLSRIRANRSD